MNIKILSDSTCDLPQEILTEYGISLIPLTVVKGEEAFLDGVTITPAEIFEHVANGGALCSTSAGSVGDYLDQFSKYAGDYEGVVHISLGSGFSSSYQNACLAAEDFDNVVVVDSQHLTTGQGIIAMKAAEIAKTAASLEEVKEKTEAFVQKVESSFLIDKLDYLVKGGRCSSAAALGANLLNLKPCIEVREGKLTVVKKYRGNFAKCLATYTKERLADREDLDMDTVFVAQTVIEQEQYDGVMEIVEGCGFARVLQTKAGCTVSCHCGPGTLGLVAVRK